MSAVPEVVGSLVSELPLVALWLFFLFGSMVRGNALYAVGRGIAEGGHRSRFSSKFTGPRMVRAEALVAKWGAIGVALCYLTVGFQSMVLVACGIMRMPLWRFEPAALVGSALWATIYTTIGFAAWEATLSLAAHSTWGLVLAMLTAICLVVVMRRRRLARREHTLEVVGTTVEGLPALETADEVSDADNAAQINRRSPPS